MSHSLLHKLCYQMEEPFILMGVFEAQRFVSIRLMGADRLLTWYLRDSLTILAALCIFTLACSCEQRAHSICGAGGVIIYADAEIALLGKLRRTGVCLLLGLQLNLIFLSKI